jgi:lanthionine synthetase-like protein
VLYPAELHEPLTETRWNETHVRDAIRVIAADADSAYDAEALWPAHEWDAWQAALPLKNLYAGAAGVAWALDALRRRGFVETALEPADVARRALDEFRREPDFIGGEALPERKRSSLFCGETGPVHVAWLTAPSGELEDELFELVRANLGNETNELMWGVPGTLLVARAVLERTGGERWQACVRASSEALASARDADGLWTQRLYGDSGRVLGPIHGFVGNVAALRDTSGAADVLARTAIVENDRANWPSSLESEKGPRLQWCHGAPGIVAHASEYLDEELLLAAAELVWDAGPSSDEKGAGICHGTAGNGYAFLKTFARTGDELWLERARAFALHALKQAERLPSRYSLFTGGVGVALFAADCLERRSAFPVVDTWD